MSKSNLKESILCFYFDRGIIAGKFLLVNALIALVGVLALAIFGGFPIYETVVLIGAVPIMAVCIGLTRSAVSLFLRIFNFRSVIIRSLIALFAFVFITLGVFSILEVIEQFSELLCVIIMILFDLIYVASVVFLLLAHKFKENKISFNNVSDENL